MNVLLEFAPYMHGALYTYLFYLDWLEARG